MRLNPSAVPWRYYTQGQWGRVKKDAEAMKERKGSVAMYSCDFHMYIYITEKPAFPLNT